MQRNGNHRVLEASDLEDLKGILRSLRGCEYDVKFQGALAIASKRSSVPVNIDPPELAFDIGSYKRGLLFITGNVEDPEKVSVKYTVTGEGERVSGDYWIQFLTENRWERFDRDPNVKSLDERNLGFLKDRPYLRTPIIGESGEGEARFYELCGEDARG